MRTNYVNIKYIQHKMFRVTSTMIKCSCRFYCSLSIYVHYLRIINNKTNKEEETYKSS